MLLAHNRYSVFRECIKCIISFQNQKIDTLSKISFEVKSGELLAVVGPVGSGKVLLMLI